MSSIGANPYREHYMTLKGLGALIIETTEVAGQPGVFRVDVGCQEKLSALSNTTNKDETVDQFCQRLRGMLRALLQEPSRVQDEKEKLVAEPVARTWAEQKASMGTGSKVIHEQSKPKQ